MFFPTKAISSPISIHIMDRISNTDKIQSTRTKS